jgi:hypothetical protein
MDSSQEFVKQLLYTLPDIADKTHFVAALYCSRTQQEDFLSLCTSSESFFTCSPLYFESPPTIPSPSVLPSNGLQFGVLLFIRNQLPEIDQIRKPSLLSNTFGVSRFGKGRRSNHPKFPYRKNYRIAAHLISIYVPDPNHRIVELFAGSCSSIPAAHLLHRSMDFVEKEAIMYSLYRDQAEEYFRIYNTTEDYYLATVTRKLKRKNRGEVLDNSDEEIPNDADDYNDPLQLRRVVAITNEDDSDDDDSDDYDSDDNDNPNPAGSIGNDVVDDEDFDPNNGKDVEDEANNGNDDQDEYDDHETPVPGSVRLPKGLPKDYSSERSGSEIEEGNNLKKVLIQETQTEEQRKILKRLGKQPITVSPIEPQSTKETTEIEEGNNLKRF